MNTGSAFPQAPKKPIDRSRNGIAGLRIEGIPHLHFLVTGLDDPLNSDRLCHLAKGFGVTVFQLLDHLRVLLGRLLGDGGIRAGLIELSLKFIDIAAQPPDVPAGNAEGEQEPDDWRFQQRSEPDGHGLSLSPGMTMTAGAGSKRWVQTGTRNPVGRATSPQPARSTRRATALLFPIATIQQALVPAIGRRDIAPRLRRMASRHLRKADGDDIPFECALA